MVPGIAQIEIKGSNSNGTVAVVAPAVDWRQVEALDTDEQHSYTQNDAGRAERFVARFGEDVRYVPDREMWLTWDNGRWQVDRDGAVVRLAIALSREMHAQVGEINGFDATAQKERAEASKEALACGDIRNIQDYLLTARVDRRIILRSSSLDSDPWLVGAKNCVIDLRTGAARDYTREDFITKELGVEFDAEARAPRWERFMDEVLPDRDVREFVQRAAGYSLTGSPRDPLIMFLFGVGRNGKSVFASTLEHIAGDYTAAVGAGIMRASKHGDFPKDEVAALAGIRLATANETSEADTLNEVVLKALTDGTSKKIRARQLYEKGFDFSPICKIWVCGNHKPTIRGNDDGIWRRIYLVPFLQKFEGANADPLLGVTLKDEASGILNWLISGCLEWQRVGLSAPDVVRAAVNEYRNDEDSLADFLDDVIADEDGKTLIHSLLYQRYEAWAVSNGVRYRLSSKMLAKKLRERGWVDRRGANGGPKVLWQDKRFAVRGVFG